MATDDKRTETLTPIAGCHHGGVAVHRDGDHTCVLPYKTAQEGQDLRGIPVFASTEGEAYERVAGLGGDVHGPAQVATKDYREGWDRTFGARGGVS